MGKNKDADQVQLTCTFFTYEESRFSRDIRLACTCIHVCSVETIYTGYLIHVLSHYASLKSLLYIVLVPRRGHTMITVTLISPSTYLRPEFVYFLFYRFRVGGRNKNKILSDNFPIELKLKEIRNDLNSIGKWYE